MSPASYLTAPPRGVARIVAPSLVPIVAYCRLVWDWAIWAALLLAVLAGGGALVLLALRARRAWRDVRDTRRELLGRLDEFARNAEAVSEKLAAAGDTAELQGSLARLRVSLARLAVLRAALDEAQGTVGRVSAYLPRT
jgi:ABC-type multidrug transport system fused ATPase/permease subunit